MTRWQGARRIAGRLAGLGALIALLSLSTAAAAPPKSGGCTLRGQVPGLTASGKVVESASVSCGTRRIEQVKVCPWYRTTGSWIQRTADCRTVTRRGFSTTAATSIPSGPVGSYRAWAWTWTWPPCKGGPAACRVSAYLSPPVSGLSLPTLSHPHSFWDSTIALILVACLCALLLCIPVWLLLGRRTRSAGISTRIGGFVTAPGDEEAPVSLTETAAERTRATLSNRSWWPGFVEAVDIAMIESAPEKLVMYTVMGGLLAAALCWLVSGTALVAVIPVLAAPWALRVYVQVKLRRQRGRFSDLLPSHLEEIAVSIRAGRSLTEAMTVVTDGAEEPLHREFERALRDENLGRSLEEVLRVISDRMISTGVEQVAVIAAMHRRTGSSVSEAIERVAEGARERADLQRELRALTAQGRMARWILTFLPPVILLVMELISPNYVRPLLQTTGGIVALVVALLMVITGSLVMKRIVDIEV
jgi:tight adherence protein B